MFALRLFDMPAGTCTVSLWRRGDVPGPALYYTLVDLADDQDPHVEAHCLGEHLADLAGGIRGGYPDGSAWLILITGADPSQVVRLLNPMAGIEARRVSPDEAADYLPGAADPTTFAAVTLLETIGVDRWTAASAIRAGCGFPNRDHECSSDGFLDLADAWAHGRLREMLGD